VRHPVAPSLRFPSPTNITSTSFGLLNLGENPEDRAVTVIRWSRTRPFGRARSPASGPCVGGRVRVCVIWRVLLCASLRATAFSLCVTAAQLGPLSSCVILWTTVQQSARARVVRSVLVLLAASYSSWSQPAPLLRGLPACCAPFAHTIRGSSRPLSILTRRYLGREILANKTDYRQIGDIAFQFTIIPSCCMCVIHYVASPSHPSLNACPKRFFA